MGGLILQQEMETGPNRTKIKSINHFPVCAINPLRDPRWGTFVKEHRRASVFHTIPWLDSLHRTYEYEPIVYTTSPSGHGLA